MTKHIRITHHKTYKIGAVSRAVQVRKFCQSDTHSQERVLSDPPTHTSRALPALKYSSFESCRYACDSLNWGI